MRYYSNICPCTIFNRQMDLNIKPTNSSHGLCRPYPFQDYQDTGCFNRCQLGYDNLFWSYYEPKWNVFGKSGISAWMQPLAGPSVLSSASSPLTFIFIIMGVLWAIRFIDIAWGFATIALCAPLFIPLYEQFHVHPVLVSVGVVAAGNSFLMSYQ